MIYVEIINQKYSVIFVKIGELNNKFLFYYTLLESISRR